MDRRNPEEEIVKHFGIGPGDLRTLLELADWLLYSASEISRVFKLRGVSRPISELRIRIQYGVKERTARPGGPPRDWEGQGKEPV